jgi:molybdopterin converting factor small subunit
MEVTVLFFGVLAEVTKTGIKVYRDAKTISSLKLMVTDDFPEIAHYKFRISVNRALILIDSELKNGDEVVFLPPFSGG